MNRLAFTPALALGFRARARTVHGSDANRFSSVRHIFGVRRRTRALSPVTLTAQPAATGVDDEVDPGAVVGTSLRVVKYPHPSLRRKNGQIEASELGQVRKLAKEMLLVMYASRGVGLAAPQVGVNKRLMVFNESGDAKKWTYETILVNPEIISRSKPTTVEAEACLSFPGLSGAVRRPEWVKVRATRPNGRKFTAKYEGWKARVFQHEYDHLDGVVYIDHLDDVARKEVQPTLDALIQAYEENEDDGAAAI